MTSISQQLQAEPQMSRVEKNKIVMLSCIVLFFSVMNGTMFMIAVPDIAREFSLLPSQVSWVVTGYIILYAIGALMYGKLADIYSLRNILTIGLSLFTLGSLVGFVAPNFLFIIIGRMIQSTGASSITALAFIVPTRYFPEERARVLGIVSSTMAFSAGVGPVIGGFIAGILNWQYLFLISSFIVFTIPLFHRWMPKESKKEGKVDVVGALLIGCAVASLILSITLFDLKFFLISLLLFSCCVWQMRKSAYPFIEPKMFQNIAFRTMIFVHFLGIFALFGSVFMMPLLLSEVYGLNSLWIGLTLFPGAMAAAFAGRIAGKLAETKGSNYVLYAAFLLKIFSFAMLAAVINGPIWIVIVILLFFNIAFPFVQTATAHMISLALPKNEIGIGMGIYNLFNFMAGAFGTAIIGKILDFQLNVSFVPFLTGKGEATTYCIIFIVLMLLTLINGSFFRFFSKNFETAKG